MRKSMKKQVLTPKQKREMLALHKKLLIEERQVGNEEAYRKLVESKPVHYYLVNFSNEELLANDVVLDHLGAKLNSGYHTFLLGRDDETAMNILAERKQAIVKATMKYPEIAEPVLIKLIARKIISTPDFVGYESQVRRLSPMVQDVIANPEEVWKVCDSAQIMAYNIPEGKEWEALDWLAENDYRRFKPLVSRYSKILSVSQQEIIDRYLDMKGGQVPDSVKMLLQHLEEVKEKRVEANKKVAEFWKEKKAERAESWLDEQGELLKFFTLEDGFPITSKEDYLFIADVFRNSGMTAYGFCKQYKIGNIEGFRKMLKKVADNDPEFASFYEEFSKKHTQQFIHASKEDIVGVATKRIDVAEVIDGHSENRDFKKLVELAANLFDNPIVATRFVENVVEYYYQRTNSYSEYSTDEEELRKRLTFKEIRFLVGADIVRDFKHGKTIDFGQEINVAIRPVMSHLSRTAREMLYDGKVGLRVRLKPYSNRFSRDSYLKETVEFLTSDGRGISVKPYMIDNAECFVDENNLFKSASVMTRIVKSVAEGKIQNQQQTEEYKNRLKNQILLDIRDIRTLEEYFGISAATRPESEGKVVGLLN